MKKLLLSLAICFISINVGFAQFEKGNFAQPTHVVAKQINAAGEITRTLESDFLYDEEGKVVAFEFPQYGLSSAFLYVDKYLLQEGVSHAGDPNFGGNPEILEFLVYTYNEEGRIKHIKHEWSEMNSTEDWQYFYDEYGRLKQKDYKDGENEYHQHYLYDYENEGKTKTESYWTSWELEGMKLKKRTISQYDDNFNLNTVHTEIYDLEGEITSTTLVTYTYTPSGKEESQIKQTLTEEEWTNTSIQRYIYDEDDRVIEQQNGTWSVENGSWNINRKVTFTYEPQEEGLTCTISFYKKSGEDWVWDVFDNQTILFGSQLKTQQKTLRHFVYEEMNGSGNINQFEFSFSYTPEPIYLDIEEKENMTCIIHPNPTNGIVTITGANLKQAIVFNSLGQRVATIQGEGETLQIDIANLPVGIYFVNITDSEGRMCVRKVVKE